jgi:hypothetical protein
MIQISSDHADMWVEVVMRPFWSSAELPLVKPLTSFFVNFLKCRWPTEVAVAVNITVRQL